MEWAPGLNVISGDNGQGKTNLLEAVSFLAMGRSFRVARVEPLLPEGQGILRLAATVSSGGVRHELTVEAGHGRGERRLDGKTAGLERTLEVFSCLAFASARLDLFRGGPEARRRFLDRGVVSREPSLLPLYREHNRALLQKNRILRSCREGPPAAGAREQILAFNRQLAVSGMRLRLARCRYVARLQEVVDGHPGLSGLVPGGPPRLQYKPSPRLDGEGSDDQAVTEELVRDLDRRLAAEMRRGHALVGPQRDDLVLWQGEADLAAYGSSGQQRAALIALKVAKMLVHREHRGEYPLFLVDDVDAELDASRTRRALALLEGPYQVLLASARGADWVREGLEARLFGVSDGIIAAHD